MKEAYVTLTQRAEARQSIKKSLFIGRLIPVTTQEEAGAELAALKKQHWDATHNCSALVLRGGVTRSSDDGEPAGTAGKPMLEALLGLGIQDVLAVVTRYFGGTLLGTGGLVRAYGSTVSLTAESASLIRRIPANLWEARLPFKLWGRGETLVRSLGYLKDVEYGEDVRFILCLKAHEEENFKKALSELSGGGAQPRLMGEDWLVEPYFPSK